MVWLVCYQYLLAVCDSLIVNCCSCYVESTEIYMLINVPHAVEIDGKIYDIRSKIGILLTVE
jgi:hypothetical protein